MTQLNITVPLPKKIVKFYRTEAKRRSKAAGRPVSRAAVMREVLEAYIGSLPCQQTQLERTA